jgi:hypothetical protein
MSLEDALKAHTTALEANTAAVTRNTELLQGALAAKGATAPKADAPKADAPKADAAAAAPKSGGKGATPQGGRPSNAQKAAAAAAANPTEEAIRTLASEFLGPKDAALKAQRKEFAGRMVEHFGVGRVTEIPEANRAEAIDYMTRFMKGEDVTFGGEADAGGDEGDEGLI